MAIISFCYSDSQCPLLLLILADNPVNGANCAYKFGGRKVWHSDPCNVVHTFTCYDEKLVLVKEKKTWEQALNHCRNASNNRRYYLATLLTEDDHVFAREKAQGTGTTNEVQQLSTEYLCY